MSKKEKKETLKKQDRNNVKLSLEKEFELREKRLNLVYKVLYVAAAIWISVFNILMKRNVETMIVSCGLVSMVTVFIGAILRYVSAELRCLKIYQVDSDEQQKSVEDRYQEIWTILAISACASAMLMLLGSALLEYITTDMIMWGMLILGVLLYLTRLFKSRYIQEKRVFFNGIIITVMCFGFFTGCCIV